LVGAAVGCRGLCNGGGGGGSSGSGVGLLVLFARV